MIYYIQVQGNGLPKSIGLFSTVSLGFCIKCTASDDLVAKRTTNFSNRKTINTELFQDKSGCFLYIEVGKL